PRSEPLAIRPPGVPATQEILEVRSKIERKLRGKLREHPDRCFQRHFGVLEITVMLGRTAVLEHVITHDLRQPPRTSQRVKILEGVSREGVRDRNRGRRTMGD